MKYLPVSAVVVLAVDPIVRASGSDPSVRDSGPDSSFHRSCDFSLKNRT
jgi:hypothetical protein